MSTRNRRRGRKPLLKESSIRRFMKLANIQPLTDPFLSKINERDEERPLGHARGKHETDEGYDEVMEESEENEEGLEESVSMKKIPDGGDPATKKGGGNGMAPWGDPPPKKGKKGKADLRKGDTAPDQKPVNEMAYKDDEPGEEMPELGGEEMGEPAEMEMELGAEDEDPAGMASALDLSPEKAEMLASILADEMAELIQSVTGIEAEVESEADEELGEPEEEMGEPEPEMPELGGEEEELPEEEPLEEAAIKNKILYKIAQRLLAETKK